MQKNKYRQYFIPRDAFFWLAHFAGWLFFLAPTLSVSLVKHSYDTQLLVADLTRFALSLPVLLLFRYSYNRFNWYLKHPFELLSLMVGYNLLTAWLVAWCVQGSVWLTHEWFAWFHAEFRVTTRDPDEMQISWLSSLVVQLAWCFIYVVVKSNGRNQSNELERIKIQNQLKDAKINTLMGQISPHFLFNGMNNIINLMDEDIPRAQRSLRAFSDMLRFSLASPNQERVSLAEELDLVRNYLAIADIHLEDKLRFNIHVTNSARYLQVPPMLLQMLVENAIKHGISLQKNGGELQIVIDDSGEDLICLVSNDGELNRHAEKKQRSGVGIKNIRQRLALLYGDAARLDLMQEGTKVVAEVHILRSLCQ